MLEGRAYAGCTQGAASIKLSVSASACYEDAGRLDTHYDLDLTAARSRDRLRLKTGW